MCLICVCIYIYVLYIESRYLDRCNTLVGLVNAYYMPHACKRRLVAVLLSVLSFACGADVCTLAFQAEDEVGGEAVAGKGPAIESVNYEGRFVKGPKPTRPEELPGHFGFSLGFDCALVPCGEIVGEILEKC